MMACCIISSLIEQNNLGVSHLKISVQIRMDNNIVEIPQKNPYAILNLLPDHRYNPHKFSSVHIKDLPKKHTIIWSHIYLQLSSHHPR